MNGWWERSLPLISQLVPASADAPLVRPLFWGRATALTPSMRKATVEIKVEVKCILVVVG